MKYFAYGSNMNPERMRDRGVLFKDRQYAVLKGWKLAFNKMASDEGVGYANIVKDESGVVEGIVYEIDQSGIDRLDQAEGCPTHYYRDIVVVKLDSGAEVEAVVYIANENKIDNNLKPTKAYLKHLLKGCDLLTKEYCEKLKKIETVD
ncbi:gamma-glutamylcyclotransferase family protein [Hippea jasoniae]|uniref:gamma-glutamylcyclotransferase family protein n=1 Tax=Hippea jasoniae TaxID=944479 RepID=UPI0005545CAD|nr:gamma-glutamylcyclotransferase family protein [Hippea jasoniae]